MGTPRARKSKVTATKRSSSRPGRPVRPDSFATAPPSKTLTLPVPPDTRRPVRPISVRAGVRIGEKKV